MKRQKHHNTSLRQHLETAANGLQDSSFKKRGSALSAQLDGNGPVGEAFRKVSRAGCNAGDLKRWLLKLQSELHIHPLERQRSYFPIERRRKLERIAADLEFAAAELGGEANFWIFALGDLRGDILGPTPALQVIELVRKLARVIKNAIPHLNVTTITASEPIIAIIEEVRRRTGRPHYAQMATSIGAACAKPLFSEGDLKMLIARRRK